MTTDILINFYNKCLGYIYQNMAIYRNYDYNHTQSKNFKKNLLKIVSLVVF